MEEKCAGIRLYGKENLRVFGCSLRRTPREEVKVMRRKRVGICLLMLMLTLAGGRRLPKVPLSITARTRRLG